MTVDADLVREAGALTADLSETVEQLLAAYVAGERVKPARDHKPAKDRKPARDHKPAVDQRGVEAFIAWSDDFVARHGLPGEDFMPL